MDIVAKRATRVSPLASSFSLQASELSGFNNVNNGLNVDTLEFQ